jgi:hypothetical protein
MMILDSYRFGGGPANPCGTGASYPAGWRFLHSELSGGLGSWGNTLKVFGYNGFGANIENVTDGDDNFCYLDAEIDKTSMDAFFTVDADVETLFDQFERDDVVDKSVGDSYIKSANDLSFNGGFDKSSALDASGISSVNLGSAWTMIWVLDYTSLPTINKNIESPLAGSNFLRLVWSGNGTDLIVRFQSPNQGYFYSGLRASGVKFVVVTYDGTAPINRSGLKLYWNSSTAETENGIYNSGAPTDAAFSEVNFGLPASAGGYFREFDMFNYAFDSSDVATAKEILEQKYTF